MSDRELLELAAEASGYTVDTAFEDCPLIYCEEAGPDGPRDWNPLEDDADAFRLAVKLNLHVEIDFDDVPPEVRVYGDWQFSTGGIFGFIADSGGDPYAATRRAIVRAAAKIGETSSNG
jgi:hypothetical protein